MVSHELHAVADAEYWYAQVKDFFAELRRTFTIDRARAARKNNGAGRFESRERCRVGYELSRHAERPNPPRDELGVLRAEVEDVDHNDKSNPKS